MTRVPKKDAVYKKIESLVKAERALYDKAGFDRRHIIVFPNGKVPLLGRIGVWLTRKAKGTVQVEYIAVNPQK